MIAIFCRIHLFLWVIMFLPATAQAQHDSLLVKFQTIIRSIKADVGVAVLGLEDRDTLSINGNRHYPMESIYKFHLAMTVHRHIDKEKFPLAEKCLIQKEDLRPDTWSPLRDKYTADTYIPLSELLGFTVSQGDNNGCDILFRLVGGTKNVEDYMHSLGVKDIAVHATEEEMHHDWNAQFTNWSTPIATVRLLDIFYRKKILSKTSTKFLWKILTETTSGPQKIKGRLPPGTIVAHRTGFSGKNATGVIAATNDVGIVTLPNGKHFAIAVFVADSTQPVEILDEAIARLSNAAWNYFRAKK